MDKTRLKLIQKLRAKRYTFEEIGEIFGISKQRAHQIYNILEAPETHKCYICDKRSDNKICKECKKKIEDLKK